jgi:hypothetical protein
MATLTELCEENLISIRHLELLQECTVLHHILSFLHINFSRFFHCSSINSMVTCFCTEGGFTQIQDPPFGSCLGRVPCSPKSISSGARYVICRVKFDEEDPMYVGLAHENGFGFAFLHM